MMEDGTRVSTHWGYAVQWCDGDSLRATVYGRIPTKHTETRQTLCRPGLCTERLATYKESEGENAEDVSEEVPFVQEVA